ncbi:hypothetical protein KAW48_10360 [candidate division WOR-3 bacterium]|nr:hypothetical protein [candidate division WOR-3 bacterium]
MEKTITRIYIVFFLLISFSGCNESSSPASNFRPPKDKIITREMAKKYAVVSVALTEAVGEEAVIIEDFREKRNISLDMNELNDRTFKKEHPDIITEWNKIQSDWKEKQASIYKEFGMSEEEWDWIAGALIMPRNRPMQEFIRKEIERIEEEGFQKETQTTDST